MIMQAKATAVWAHKIMLALLHQKLAQRFQAKTVLL